MLPFVKNLISMFRHNKKGTVGAAAGVIIALIIAGAIIGAVIIYTNSQTHPFWEF